MHHFLLKNTFHFIERGETEYQHFFMKFQIYHDILFLTFSKSHDIFEISWINVNILSSLARWNEMCFSTKNDAWFHICISVKKRLKTSQITPRGFSLYFPFRCFAKAKFTKTLIFTFFGLNVTRHMFRKKHKMSVFDHFRKRTTNLKKHEIIKISRFFLDFSGILEVFFLQISPVNQIRKKKTSSFKN